MITFAFNLEVNASWPEVVSTALSTAKELDSLAASDGVSLKSFTLSEDGKEVTYEFTAGAESSEDAIEFEEELPVEDFDSLDDSGETD